MAALETERIWERTFPDVTRPALYLNDETDEDGFKPLADPQDFIAELSDLSHLQLYATSSNNQLALKQAQDEYLDIARQIALLKGKDQTAKEPQALQDPEDFEERKEASLYGYKYEAQKPALLHNGIPGNRLADDITEQEKRDVRLFQNPFEQGGFVPTDRQFKAILAKAANPKNIDGWTPVEKDGKQLIPRRNLERPEYTNVYVRRNVDENGELIRPGSSGTDDSIATPSKVENKRLTRTRFGGKKFPPTRDVSEAPSAASTPGRKRAATPALESRDLTPSTKRQRTSGDDKPRHPNQYTKRKERAALQAAMDAANGVFPTLTTMPDWSSMSREQLLSRKWTDEELIACIKKNHSWLHTDPAKAQEWRDKILNGINPVRSWSMVKKWEEWKVTNKDKRPRKKVGLEKEATPAVDTVVVEEVFREERRGSDVGNEGGRKAAKLPGTNGVSGRVDRSATATPGAPRRSMRNR